jgi:F-type H+-transporting ATPase subunit b
MPQIAQILETYASQFFWLLIVFGLIYFGIARAMLPKVEATVEARSRKIADDLAAAERARAAATGAEEAWHKQVDEARAVAQGEIASAKAKGAADAANQIAKANAKLAEQAAASEASIADARSKALASIGDVAAEAAQDMVAKLAGLKVSTADAAKAAREALANG